MAGCTYLKSVIAAAGLVTVWLAPAHATVFSIVEICDAAPDCAVSNDGAGPPPANAGYWLTSSKFNQYYVDNFGYPSDHYQWTIEGGNTTGQFLYGSVHNSFIEDYLITAGGSIQRVYDANFGFRVTDVNNNGLFIGTDGQQPFAAFFGDDPSAFATIVQLDDASMALLDSWGVNYREAFGDSGDAAFNAVDDANNISGSGGGISYVLAAYGSVGPFEPLPEHVPEPSSIGLLASALGMLLWVRKRDRRYS